jgi:hypothetical protein
MTYQTVEERQMSRYLLGQLGDQEQKQLEERLMTQDDSFEQLQVLEDELIDEYLKNKLSERDREDFEKHFLSPERRQRLRFATALRSYVATANEGKEREHSKVSLWQTFWAALRTPSPTLSYGLSLAMLAVLVGSLWMAGTIRHLNTEVARVRTEQGSLQAREQQLQRQLEEQRGHSVELEQQLLLAQAQSPKVSENSSAALVALALTPGLVRDAGTSNNLTISSDTRLVALRLELADQTYESYRVVLQDSQGSEICILNKVKPKRLGTNPFITLTFPADILPPDDYSLKLSGASKTGEFDPLDNYRFRVVRR